MNRQLEPSGRHDIWHFLKQHTAARIDLGHTGGSIPSAKLLEIKFAQSSARSAVKREFNPAVITDALDKRKIACLKLATRISGKKEYLLSPDKGRMFHPDSAEQLHSFAGHAPEYDLAVIVSDGLSTLAAEQHFLPFLTAFLPAFSPRTVAPILLVPFARVGLLNHVGELLKVKVALILLGERPGMSSPDSLGAYFAFQPHAGQTDADRNCVSNIRPEGLPPSGAAGKLAHLLNKAFTEKRSGFMLKDDYCPQLKDTFDK